MAWYDDPINERRSEYYGALQDVVDAVFPETDDGELAEEAGLSLAEYVAARALGEIQPPNVRRLDVILAAESADLPDDLREIVNLLPPGDYTRRRLCDQLNSAIVGHAWGQVYGTVE